MTTMMTNGVEVISLDELEARWDALAGTGEKEEMMRWLNERKTWRRVDASDDEPTEAERVLGIKHGDDPKAAYRALAKKHHPDVGGNAEKMVEINAAYEVLTTSTLG